MNTYRKELWAIGGGTIQPIANHLVLSAPAYGSTARNFVEIYKSLSDKLDAHYIPTRMAGGKKMYNTVEDMGKLADQIISLNDIKIVFWNCAIVDYEPTYMSCQNDTPKVSRQEHVFPLDRRLSTKNDSYLWLNLTPSEKIIRRIRKTRKDIFLIGTKATYGLTEQEQYLEALNMLKSASCNLVFSNDTKEKRYMVVTPEEARYHVSADRDTTLKGLAEMAILRSHLSFTRSTVVAGEPVSWSSDLVPSSLRTVVDHCIGNGAYKPFRGATVGHFAARINPTTFLTSIRKSNFNDLHKNGLVRVETDGSDTVTAYGAKPSVGGQSQRIIFSDHADKEYDCIVHFHCPVKEGSLVPVVSQREYECGSHQCGQNTSNGLKQFGNLSAVMLDQHGPNIVFNHNINPQEVIAFIEANFELSEKTGGPVKL